MNKPRPPNKAKLIAYYEVYVCKVLNYMKEHFIKYTFTLFQNSTNVFIQYFWE